MAIYLVYSTSANALWIPQSREVKKINGDTLLQESIVDDDAKAIEAYVAFSSYEREYIAPEGLLQLLFMLEELFFIFFYYSLSKLYSRHINRM